MATQTTITELIPKGHENRIGRRELIRLAIAYGLIDSELKDKERQLRYLIHDARTYKLDVICNAGDGFFRPTPDDLPYMRHDIIRHEEMAKQLLIPLHQTKKLLADYEAGRITE